MHCKKVGVYLLVLLIIILLFSNASFSQPVSDKKGGVCFRIDGEQPYEKLQQVDSVFSKYGYKFSLALSYEYLLKDSAYFDAIKPLLIKGHEWMDRTPSSQTQYFDLTYINDTALYVTDPGVDHFFGERVCLKYSSVDTLIPHNEGFVRIEGNSVISYLPGEFKDITGYMGLYFNKLDKVTLWSNLRAQIPTDPDTLEIRSLWDEPVNYGKQDSINYHKLTRSDVTMSPAAIQLLGKRTLMICDNLNIPRPYTWIHPGGRMPYIPANQLKENLGDHLSFKEAASYDYPTYLCYDEYNPISSKQFAMQYGEISIERRTFKSIKNALADYIARHYLQIDLSSFSNPFGGFSAMIQRMDSLLFWCSKNNIYVDTYLQWKARLYDYTPNGALNAFPALDIDLNEDSYPDGYLKSTSLKSKYVKNDGVTESGGCSFEIDQSGQICSISKLAGLEKGKNYFSIWTKGTDANKGTILVRFNFPENGTSTILLFPADSSAWIKYSDSIDIPDSISLADIIIENQTQTASVIKISGMSLKTTGPLIIDFYSNKVCNGDTSILKSLSTPADSIQFLNWDLNGDGKFDDAQGSVVRHLFGGSGVFNVGLRGMTFSGKSKAIYKNVIVMGVKAAFDESNGCAGLVSSFKDKSVIIGDYPSAYFWNFGDDTPGSSEVNPTHTFTDQGSFDVKHIVKTVGGCADSTTKTIVIESPPTLDLTFSGDTVFAEGDSVIATVHGDYDNVIWSDGSDGNSLVIKSTGTWWVKGFKNKCYSEVNFSTLMKEYGLDPVVMTVITPNGDGFNDVWKILNLSKIGHCEVELYDRWGIKVYSSRDYDNSWDGTYNGKNLGNDTYYYFIHTSDGNLFKGTLNIVK